MPIFYYRAKTKNAQTVENQITAEHRDDAIEKLHQQGLVPVSVEEGKKGRKAKHAGVPRPAKIRLKEIYLFTRQLASLLKAGVPILRALETIANSIRNLYFKSVVATIGSGIRGGKSFSDCLLEYPQIFSSIYATMIKAGEESGRLKEALFAMADYLKKQNELMVKVRTAVAYPLVMMVFGLGTVAFILTYVMPQITRLFIDLQQTMPLPTRIVMAMSDFLIHRWWVMILIVLGLWGFSSKWFSSSGGKAVFSHISLRFPLAGNFLLRIEVTRFCRTMELLLQSSVSLVRAMQLAIPVVNNALIRGQLSRAQEDVLAGRSLGLSLKDRRILPAMLSDIVSVGEESGMLADAFGEIAQAYEQDTEEAVKIMTTLLEPLMIMVVGSMVGFIVIAMLLPIFQLDVFAK